MIQQHESENGNERFQPQALDLSATLDEELAFAGEPYEDDHVDGEVGRTMYDTPNSKDHTVTVLLPREQIGRMPSQSLLRILSRSQEKGGDGRVYLAAVVQGPFAEPDGLRADAPIVVTTTVRGGMFMPRYHGRVQAEILGEEMDGTLLPPRFRPLPNSPVVTLSQQETRERLKLIGNVPLGLAVGYEDMEVALSSERRDVFFKHLAVLGTTGAGKSTTVSGLIGKLSQARVAVVVFDTEGEYTHLMHATTDAVMLEALKRRGLQAHGITNIGLLHLVGRETTNKEFADNQKFCLRFSNLSPYTIMGILDLNDAQQARYLKAYDIAKTILGRLKIFPRNEEDKAALLELDEMESGYPDLTLAMMYDVVHLCARRIAGDEDIPYLQSKDFYAQREAVAEVVNHAAELPINVFSWRVVQGALSRLLRLGIFDNALTRPPNYEQITQSGRVTIIDLSDTDSPQINNLVISEILRGLHLQQNENYAASEGRAELGESRNPQKVVVVIEEAHEFLSAERVKQMPVLFQQVARIARRGRKRWLGLMFVTQTPQHLPDDVLGLVNNFLLHKIADSNVINRLKHSVGGVDEGLWDRLPNLAPGQAVVRTEGMSRALLVAMDPTPSQLLMAE